MIYTSNNAGGATVFDMDGLQQLRQVVSVDTDTGDVCMAHEPLRIKGGEIDCFTVRFASIHPIQGLEPRPVMFHCYGRTDIK